MLTSSINVFGQLDEYALPDIPVDFQGTYIPEAFINNFEATIDYDGSYKLADQMEFHYILIVEKNNIWSSYAFHDGYAISAKDYTGYQFVQTSFGPILVDDKGNRYKRISTATGKDSYLSFEAYLVSVIKKKIDSPTPHPFMVVKGNSFYFMINGPNGPAYGIELDTLLINRNGDRKFNFYLLGKEDNKLLGVCLLDETIEIWYLFSSYEMTDNVIYKRHRQQILLYSLKRKSE
jgi:hypothetical protein